MKRFIAAFALFFFIITILLSQDNQAPSAPSNMTVKPNAGNAYLLWDASTDNVGVESYNIYLGNDLVGTISSHQNKVWMPDKQIFRIEAEEFSPVNWTLNTTISGYNGTGYLTNTKSHSNNKEEAHFPGDVVGDEDEWFTINFWIEKAGRYRMDIRNYHANHDGDNDIWMHFPNEQEKWIKVGDVSPGSFSYLDFILYNNCVNLEAGFHTCHIAGRSSGFSVDYFLIHETNLYGSNTNTPSDVHTKALAATSNSKYYFKVENLQPENSYTFKIEAVDKAGNKSSLTSLQETTTQDVTPPLNIETSQTTLLSDNSAKSTWSAGIDDVAVVGYNVYLNYDKINTNLVTQTQFTFENLNYETKYYVGITSVDAAGNEAEIIPSSFFTTGDAPPTDIALSNRNAIQLYPCPASQFVYLSGENISSLNILSLNGKLMQYHANADLQNTIILDISNLESGIYILQIKQNGTETLKKLAIQ